MKIIRLSLLVLLTITFSSCKKENKKPSAANPEANSFFLVQNNTAFIAKKVIVSGGANEYVQIDAKSIPNKPYDKAYNMNLRTDLQPGDYAHNEHLTGTFSLTYSAPGQSFLLDHGTIHVLSNDTIVKRMVFNFEAGLVNIMSGDSIQVTGGKAIINY